MVLFLNALPPTGQDKWLPGLLKSVAGGLQDRLIEQNKVEDVHVAGETTQLRTEIGVQGLQILLMYHNTEKRGPHA